MAKLLTIEDIRKPSNESGFRHVHNATGGLRSANRNIKLWRTKTYKNGKLAVYGPVRHEALLAAQDYCDYINTGVLPPPAALATLDKSGRPQAKRRTLTPRESEARKVIREEVAKNPPSALHEPLCYLVGVQGDAYAVKVGYADYNVHSRLDSLQTGNPRELILLGQLPGGKETEARLHAKYIKWNVLGEWFWPAADLLAEFGLTIGDVLGKLGKRKVFP